MKNNIGAAKAMLRYKGWMWFATVIGLQILVIAIQYLFKVSSV